MEKKKDKLWDRDSVFQVCFQNITSHWCERVWDKNILTSQKFNSLIFVHMMFNNIKKE